MSDLPWLTARPIAHRGLHDATAGVIENTASAVAAACRAGYSIEVDLQRSADRQAMVHHDETLDRLTQTRGAVRDLTAAALQGVAFTGTADRMMTLGDLLALVAGRVPLVIELKSLWDGDTGLAERAVSVLQGYGGKVALMSFDPLLVDAVRRLNPEIPRGLGVRRSDLRRTPHAGGPRGFATVLGAALSARPQFIACRLQDLSSLPAVLFRRLMRWPYLAWTVRSPADQAFALRYADQVIFEGFTPL